MVFLKLLVRKTVGHLFIDYVKGMTTGNFNDPRMIRVSKVIKLLIRKPKDLKQKG